MKSAIEILLGKDGWLLDAEDDGAISADTGNGDRVLVLPGGSLVHQSMGTSRTLDIRDVDRLVEAVNAIREAKGEPPLFVAGEKQGGEELRETAPECSLYRFSDTGECALYVVADCQSDAVEVAENEGWGALGEGDSVTIKNLGQPVIDPRIFGGAK